MGCRQLVVQNKIVDMNMLLLALGNCDGYICLQFPEFVDQTSDQIKYKNS